MEHVSGDKREREVSDELPDESPEAKRLREHLLLDILADEADDGGDENLASVMKSLEAEIGFPSPGELSDPLISCDVTDLGYLLGASDDELGLPPSGVPSSGGDISPGDTDEWGIGQILEPAGEWTESFVGLESAGCFYAGENGIVVDGEWLDYSDELYAAAEFAGLPWQQESLPAV
ncbi:hypothetical protein HPP92_019465 [Vanilla planifolia]|uniref:Uncharacterized protein n=1 Tax=Vanilla planifolia TaxID=51239 RepID=A0A835Q6Z4_VANPL|nr:hypothetical protein HPP92_027373 [Vanilla planifolia]KAG0465301.1 hypothetical protein HPP92_019465 [Vanilla planifolia]